MSALCAPGVYVYLYRVTDAAGNIGVATVTVYLVERTAVSFQLRHNTNATTMTAATAEAGLMQQLGSLQNIAYRQSVVALLSNNTDNVQVREKDRPPQ